MMTPEHFESDFQTLSGSSHRQKESGFTEVQFDKCERYRVDRGDNHSRPSKYDLDLWFDTGK